MNYIFKHSEFILEKKRFIANCVLIKLDIKNWDDITSIIDKDDIYYDVNGDFGIQKHPHVSLLYPVMEYNKDKVFDVLDNVLDKQIDIEIDSINYFKAPYYDILKFNIKPNEYLNNIHKELKDNIKNDYKFGEFIPHITIAYLKPGKGDKYVKKLDFKMENQNNIFFTIKYNIEHKYEWKIDVI